MFDVDDVIDNDLDPEMMAYLIGKCAMGLTSENSKEAKWLLELLKCMQSDCKYAVS